LPPPSWCLSPAEGGLGRDFGLRFNTSDEVKQLEAAFEAHSLGVEKLILKIEQDQHLDDMHYDQFVQLSRIRAGYGIEKALLNVEHDQRLEGMPVDGLDFGISESSDACEAGSTGGSRSLLVCYIPREANKAMIRNIFSPYGEIDSVYLVHKDGKPACYGFVNFHTKEAALLARTAATNEEVVLVDKRDETWHVKAEFTTTDEVPKKIKKRKCKSGAATPPLDLRALQDHPMSYSTSQQFKFTQPLSYTVQPKFDYKAFSYC
jgi:hypothetical protein